MIDDSLIVVISLLTSSLGHIYTNYQMTIDPSVFN